MFIAIAVVPGRRQTIQNTTVHPRKLPRQNLLLSILLHSLPRQKARPVVLIQNPVVDRPHRAKCPVPPVTDPEAVLGRVPGVVVVVPAGVAEDGVAEVAAADSVVVVVADSAEEAGEDNFSCIHSPKNANRNFTGSPLKFSGNSFNFIFIHPYS
jgi:hypothetical protein